MTFSDLLCDLRKNKRPILTDEEAHLIVREGTYLEIAEVALYTCMQNNILRKAYRDGFKERRDACLKVKT